MHISTLIRISFIAATSNADQLRLAGLDSLQVISKNIFSIRVLIVLYNNEVLNIKSI